MGYLNYKYYSSTDKGKCYNNEDALLTLNLGNDTYFFAVADGMGAEEGGEVASSVTLYTIEKHLKKLVHGSSVVAEDLKKIMADLFDIAQSALNQFSSEYPGLTGMATTLTALLIHQDKYVWGHIGDSRMYLIKDSKVGRLTRDHTLSEDPNNAAESQNMILPSHYVSELTRKIDGGQSSPDIYPLHEPWSPVEKNTTWLLCTDGLLVDRRKDFKELFLNFKLDPKEMHCVTPALVKKALKNGSNDNITVISVVALDDDIDLPNGELRPENRVAKNRSTENDLDTDRHSVLRFLENLWYRIKGLKVATSS